MGGKKRIPRCSDKYASHFLTVECVAQQAPECEQVGWMF